MAPFIRENPSTAACNNNDINGSRSIVCKTKKWSCAADDGWSDYDALVKAMRLGRKKVIDILLEKGSRVVKRSNAPLPLHLAVARMGWLRVVKILISLGARVSDKNSQGDTTLHLAFVNGARDRVVDMLLTKYLMETNINVENNDGLSLLHIACTRSTDAFVKFALAKFIEREVADIDCQINPRSQSKYAGFSPLHFAVLLGKFEIAALLLRSGASVYVQDCHGSTPIHLALYTGNQEMIDLLFAHDKRNDNCINNFGLTHFMAACAGRMPHIVKQFLQQPIASILVNSRVRDVRGRLCAGYSPIHFAAEFGNFDTVQVLLDFGASRSSVTIDNWTPIELARYSGRDDIVLLLTKYYIRENESVLVNKVNDLKSKL